MCNTFKEKKKKLKIPYLGSGKKLKIILDTNVFFIPLKFRIDIFEELKNILKRDFDLIVLPQVYKELEKLSRNKSPKMKKDGVFALKLAEKCKIVNFEEKITVSVDDLILKAAKEWKATVFTNDKALRKKLKDINVSVIYVRQKTRLEINGRV